jgi:hypothetical protein
MQCSCRGGREGSWGVAASVGNPPRNSQSAREAPPRLASHHAEAPACALRSRRPEMRSRQKGRRVPGILRGRGKPCSGGCGLGRIPTVRRLAAWRRNSDRLGMEASVGWSTGWGGVRQGGSGVGRTSQLAGRGLQHTWTDPAPGAVPELGASLLERCWREHPRTDQASSQDAFHQGRRDPSWECEDWLSPKCHAGRSQPAAGGCEGGKGRSAVGDGARASIHRGVDARAGRS